MCVRPDRHDGFDPNVDGTVRTIAVQADGKILVGGYFSSVGGSSRTNIARLKPDGSVDDTFHSSVTWRGCPNCAFVYSIVVQPDAKILVAGAFTEFGGEPRTNIARFNPDGSVDAQFNPSNPSADTDDEIPVLALQPDGKILL